MMLAVPIVQSAVTKFQAWTLSHAFVPQTRSSTPLQLPLSPQTHHFTPSWHHLTRPLLISLDHGTHPPSLSPPLNPHPAPLPSPSPPRPFDLLSRLLRSSTPRLPRLHRAFPLHPTHLLPFHEHRPPPLILLNNDSSNHPNQETPVFPRRQQIPLFQLSSRPVDRDADACDWCGGSGF